MAIVIIEETDLVLLIEKAVARAFEKQPLSIIPDPYHEDLIQAPHVAKLLNVSLSTVHTYKKLGIIPFHRIGRRVYFRESEVLASLRKIN
jgi:excisionase family DNA binding protein